MLRLLTRARARLAGSSRPLLALTAAAADPRRRHSAEPPLRLRGAVAALGLGAAALSTAPGDAPRAEAWAQAQPQPQARRIRPLVIFVLGGPGAGKGTQCARLVSELGFVHLSAGDLLRAERRDPASVHGAEIEGHIKNGSIVPNDITMALIRRAMRAAQGNRFLVDGYPRDAGNAQGWEEAYAAEVENCGVLFFECDEQVLVARCIERGKLSGRVDDNVESLRKRLATYERSSMPVVRGFEARGLVTSIDSNQPVDVVYRETRKAVRHVVERELLATAALQVESAGRDDWATYSSVCAADISQAGADGELLSEGLEAHKGLYFDPAMGGRAAIVGAQVKVAEGAAVVTYTRVVSFAAEGVSAAQERRFIESRVFRREGAGWVNVHLHSTEA